MSRPDYIKCIRFNKQNSWCGKRVYSFDWLFETIEHAAMNRGNNLLVCAECSSEVFRNLKENTFSLEDE